VDAFPARITARLRARRLLKGALAGAAALALAFASIAIAPDAQVAQANPAAAAGTTTIAPVGPYSGTVPAGVCSVTATVLGAAGGSSVTTASNANGAGARVTATYPVVPGLAYSGTVGGGGAGATSGTNAGGTHGGGNGGVAATDHHGAGGGGYTDLLLGGTLAVIAGGGGGAGGGHSTGSDGAGGNAGLPAIGATGVTNGSTGNVGEDTPLSTVVGGGVGGSATPGAGGVNSASGSVNGVAGAGNNGGNGGTDPNYDAGGGGGGGYAGGGGGASTVVQNSGSLQIAGAGGGGGSSYVAPSIPLGAGTSTPSLISSIAGVKLPGAGSGAPGSVSLVWNSCVYDLSVDKSVAPLNTAINGTVTWTVAVTNIGPAAMTQGDTVTITDSLPGAGATTITGISVSGGSNAILGRGAFTCTAAVGAAMLSSLDCSRPYQVGAGAASGVRGLDVGEILTVTYTQVVTEAVGTVLTNTATVVDRTTGDSNDTDTAATTVVAPPGAVNDSNLGNALGTVVNVPVKNNDTGTLQAGSVVLWNPAGAGSPIASPYVVAGQGTWTVASDIVTFTPLAGFKGDPTPVTYRVTATNGLHATATVTIGYVPVAFNDSVSGVAIGATTTVHPLTNDDGDFVGSTLRLINPSTLLPVTGPVVVAGQGTWTISGTDVIFTPLPGFLTDPDPIGYQITDTTGDTVGATITITSVPSATNDSSLGNALGTTVNVNVLTNDTGSWNTSSLVFVSGLGTTLVVAGQGTWTVQPGGVIRFVPLASFKGDPTPVGYRVTDVTGDQVTAQLTVAYVPSAADDSSLGHVMGSDVTVSVLGNDNGDFVAGSVRLMNGVLPVTSLTVPGEGVWTVVGDTVVFDPQSGFLVDPAPVYYRVADTTGDFATATVTVAYLPQAANDHAGSLTIGAVASVPVLANDTGSWTAGSLRLIDPISSLSVTGPVVVASQGTWTISGTNLVFTPLPGFLLDPTPMGYRVTDTTGDTVSASVSLDYRPAAVDDSSLGNALGTVINLNVLSNDTGSFDTTTLGFGPGNVGVGAQLVVAGQGTWAVVAPGVIRFTPLGGFLGDPTPVGYQVSDTLGDATGALMTITYVPAAVNDSSPGNAFGSDVNVDVLANDNGDFAAGSVRIMDAGNPVMSVYVAGQGTWIVEADDTITFQPDPGFLTDPSPVTYRVSDTTGDEVTAQLTVAYLPEAVDDAQGGLTIGSVATVAVLGNDNGDWVNSSLRLIVPVTLVVTAGPVVVAGQGTWTISGTNVVFTPLPGFLVDPDPIDYRITDSTGDHATAQVELDYGPGAADDADLGNVLGSAVDVHVFDNDSGTFDNATLGFGAGTGPGTTLVVASEGTWSVLAGGVIRFTPLPSFLTDPSPVTYYADDITGDPASASITITYLPEAANDSDLGNAFGTDVNVDVLTNDTGDFPAGGVRLLDGALPVTMLVVPGEGTWTVELDDTVTFSPDSGFLVDPTAIQYQVTDSTGDTVTASITVTYLPLAVDDHRGNLTIGAPVTITVLSNDNGSFVTSTVRLINPATLVVASGPVTIAGEGTWSLGASGSIVFTPVPGFLVDPAAIDYRVTDVTGDTASATITLDYVPAAADDESLANALGTIVDLDVLDNDTGSFDVSSLEFTAGGTTFVQPGVGTWTVRSGGVIRFTPLGSFLGDPAPVDYTVTDVTGDTAAAQVMVTYVPAAADDSDLGNAMGADVNVDVLANDTGDFAPGSVRIMDGLLPVLSLTVAGQGTWTVEADDTITFDPDTGFLTDPTAIHYRVTDTTGDNVSAIVTVEYLPQTADDSDLGNTIGSTVNVPVLANDTGSFVASSVRIVGSGGPVAQLIVPGEGLWVANSDGTVSFFPEVGFLLDPAPVDYRVTDTTGDSVDGQVTVTYVPTVAPDVKNGGVIGSPTVVNVLTNDTGDFDLSTLRIIDPVTHLPVLTVVVTGEGTWTTDTTLGRLTFTPEPGFLGNPTPVTYEITDITGDVVQALATITYLPIAEDDESLDNPSGTMVTVSILGNDLGLFDTTTPRLMSHGTPMMSMLVPGEGTWRMHISTSTVTFEPLPGFTGDPTPVPYRVADLNGNWVTANVTITYLQPAALALTGASVDAPLYGSLAAILMGIIVVLVTRLRRVARHRM